MKKLFTMVSVSAFLVLSGISALAGQSDMSRDGMKSHDSQSSQSGSSIESQSSSQHDGDLEDQKSARPGVAGEEGTDSMFGSPATLPPNENSPGYTGADKEAEKRERQHQGM